MCPTQGHRWITIRREPPALTEDDGGGEEQTIWRDHQARRRRQCLDSRGFCVIKAHSGSAFVCFLFMCWEESTTNENQWGSCNQVENTRNGLQASILALLRSPGSRMALGRFTASLGVIIYWPRAWISESDSPGLDSGSTPYCCVTLDKLLSEHSLPMSQRRWQPTCRTVITEITRTTAGSGPGLAGRKQLLPSLPPLSEFHVLVFWNGAIIPVLSPLFYLPNRIICDNYHVESSLL